MSKDLFLDSQIRAWVFLPILLLTYLIECLMHYTMILIRNRLILDPNEVQALHIKTRLSNFEINYKHISKQAFQIRKNTLKVQLEAVLKKHSAIFQSDKSSPIILDNSEKFLNILKEYSSKDLPMILAGTWVSYMFSGFICTKVPFPLTSSVRPMLQRNIQLTDLEPSWVSSGSWYFLNVFGIRNLIKVLLKKDNDKAEWKNIEVFQQEVVGCLKEYSTTLDMI